MELMGRHREKKKKKRWATDFDLMMSLGYRLLTECISLLRL